ncbi:MAG: ubiquinone biosynthesis protein COQ4 [Myxococcota bacterium]|jgi:ubiquinone biosynthesis protein COQ4
MELRRRGALTDHSFGRAYLNFLDEEGISPDGLIEAAAYEPAHQSGPDAGWICRHLRDTHDLWHKATGYKGDVVGEASLLAFTLAQTGNPGLGLIALGAAHTLDETEYRRLIMDGFRRGLVARWFVSVDWVGRLELPLDEVRRRLRLDDPPNYVPLRE